MDSMHGVKPNQVENNNFTETENTVEEINDLRSMILDESLSNDLERHMISYTASVVQNDIIEGKWYTQIKCKECLHVFKENEIIIDELVKLKMKTTKLGPVNKSTFQICLVAEKLMQKYKDAPKNYQNISKEVYKILNLKDLFRCSDFEHDKNHKETLINMIVQMYIKKRQTYISRCNTLAIHDVFLRKNLTKLVHFKGQ